MFFNLKLNNPPLLLVLFLVFLGIFMVVMAPIFTIWSLNLLFHLEIPVTNYTWLAVWWLLLLSGRRSPSQND